MSNRKLSTIKALGTKEEFEKAIMNANGTIVMTNATWCPVCKGSLAEFSKLSQAHPDIAFLTIDPGDHFETVSKVMNVTSYPSFLVYKEGVCVRQVTGADLAEVGKALNDLRWGQFGASTTPSGLESNV